MVEEQRKHKLGPDRWAVVSVKNSEADAVQDDWLDLASHAAEPNVFHEPWFLRPSWRTFGAGPDEVVAIYRRGRSPAEKPDMIGLFPLTTEKTLGHPTVSLWNHPYGFLQTPLLRRGRAAEALFALLDYLRAARPDAGLFRFQLVHGQGVFQQALQEVINSYGLLTFERERYNRAALVPRGTVEDYLAPLSGPLHREDRRKQRRLREKGHFELVKATDDPARHIEEFLELEASGWKGEEGTAIACDPAHAAWFREVASAAAARGQFDGLAMRIDGKPVAISIDLITSPISGNAPGPTKFLFKIAYDESLKKLSPGVLLSIETVRRTFADGHPPFTDSCAAPGHPMIDRLWSDRVQIQDTLVVLPGRRLARWAAGTRLAAMHAGRCVRRLRGSRDGKMPLTNF